MRFSRDDDSRLAGDQAFAQETGDGGEQRVFISVELHRVLVRMHWIRVRGPLLHWGQHNIQEVAITPPAYGRA